MENKLTGNADHYTTEQLKTSYISGRLGGQAIANLQPYLRETHPNRITTQKHMMEHLWEEYYDPNVREDSLKAYYELKYKVGDDIRKFKNEFVRLAGETGREPRSWKEEFNSRLTERLQTSLTRDYIDDFVDFDAFARLAVRIVGNWARNRDANRNGRKTKTAKDST